MFDKNLFNYDSEKHVGYYNGELVPSITQLLEVFYPLSSDIPTERLTKAAERGTEVHALVEKINKLYRNYGEEDARAFAYMCDNKDALNYYRFLKAYKLLPYSFEEEVYLMDHNQDLIAYGHYDIILLATETITVGDKVLFEKDKLYLFDLKTVSQLEEQKVQSQCEFYRTAYNQNNTIKVELPTCALKIRDDEVKLYYFDKTKEDTFIVDRALIMKGMWESR